MRTLTIPNSSFLYAGLALMLPLTAQLLVTDYRAYKRLSPGGLPHNAWGWMKSNFYKLYQHNPLIHSYFHELLEEGDDEREWLFGIQERLGSRPRIARHPVPNRQLDEYASEEIGILLETELVELAKRNPSLLMIKVSGFEKHGSAIFLADSRQPSANPVVWHTVENVLRRELAHVHSHRSADNSTDCDYSLHMTLAPKDCITVLSARLGQRALVAGAPLNRMPSNYMMIYAPRTRREVETVLRLVRASIGYLAGIDPSKMSELH